MQNVTKWKAVPGFSNYETSTDGLARKISYVNGAGKTVPARELAMQLGGGSNEEGKMYRYVTMVPDQGKSRFVRLNRMVALAHLPNPLGLPIVGHKKDKDKTDNRVCNLEWISYGQNVRDSIKNGCFVPRGKSTPIEVVEAAFTHWLVTHNSAATARKFNIRSKTMGLITAGKRFRSVTQPILDISKGKNTYGKA